MNNNETRKSSSEQVNVALYLRAATHRPTAKDHGSLDAQHARLNDVVQHRRQQGENWLVTQRLVEAVGVGNRHGVTPQDADHPAREVLLKLARDHMIDVVMVTSLDRISRSITDLVSVVSYLDRYGVRLVSIREKIDLTSPPGRLSYTLLKVLVGYQREVIAFRP